MNPTLILLGIILLPLIVLSLLRANAAVAFLSLCLGSVLAKYILQDAVKLSQGYVAPDSQFSAAAIGLLLLWLPVCAAAISMSSTISKQQRLLNALPALALGLVGALLSVPLLPAATSVAIQGTPVWEYLKSYQSLIVIVATVACLLTVRLRKSPKDKEPKNKSK